ncbi:MAG: hypothetical protein ACOX2K_02885 [Bacillota bacterium]
MSDSLEVLSYRELAKAYGLLDQGEVVGGEFCFSTPIGLAKPSIWRGDFAFLERLGGLLLDYAGKLGKLSLSRLLPTLEGKYSFKTEEAAIILSSWETGPACDTHNGFELFTVLAGVAHWHQLTSRPGRQLLSKWRQQYQRLLDSLSQAQPPDLHKRTLNYWEGLVELWSNCLRQGLAILDDVDPEQLQACLTLGIHSFDDFVYLADVHRVHYNPIYRSHWNLPASDLTGLLACCEGDLRIAENMLLSYTKVRPLPLVEKRLVLADLWYPRGLSLEDLLAPGLSILAIRRMQTILERRMALVADLEVLLLPEETADIFEYEDKQPPMAAKAQPVAGAAVASAPESVAVGQAPNPMHSQGAPIMGDDHRQGREGTPGEQVELIPTVAPQREAQSAEEVKAMNEEKDKKDLQQQTEVTESVEEAALAQSSEPESSEAKPVKKVLVWKPFPRPLYAPVELILQPQPEPEHVALEESIEQEAQAEESTEEPIEQENDHK